MQARLFFVAMAIVVMASGCGNVRTTDSTEEDVVDSLDIILATDSLFAEYDEKAEEAGNLPRTVDETFEDFIFNFASRERFQKARITFPLHLRAFDDDMVIYKEEWQYQELFGGRDFYTVFFSSMEQSEIEKDSKVEAVDFENINLTDSVVKTLHFDKQEGLWKLTKQTLSAIEKHPLHDFLQFYGRFASDSLFRHSALQNSIQYVTTDPEDEFTHIEGTISAEQWDTFAPELPRGEITNINYGQPLARSREIVLLKRGIANGMYDELHFHNGERGWKLNYYEN
ncbi:MAG: DUF4348 domain-containing protein [Bacteroidaceae bacterium]|nr:DUF4348 domain-containing protein [Bacteroidaceae bacterium]